jgi:hypothetical protein
LALKLFVILFFLFTDVLVTRVSRTVFVAGGVLLPLLGFTWCEFCGFVQGALSQLISGDIL